MRNNILQKNIYSLLQLMFAGIIYLFLILDTNFQFGFTPLSISILIIIFYIIVTFNLNEVKEYKSIKNIITSLFFGISFVLGREYLWNDSFFINLNIKNILIIFLQILIASFLFYEILILLNRNYNKTKTNCFMNILNSNNVFKIFIIILICWIPYMILMYPTFLNPDSLFELAQYWQIDNLQSHDVILINQNQLITAHHPVLYTYLIGIFSKFININIGLYVYNILQTVFIIYALSNLLVFVNKRLSNNKILSYIYIIICFYPFIPYLFTSLEKDILFIGIFIFFIIEIYKMLFEEKFNLFVLIISSVFIVLLRNNVKYIYFIFILILFFTIKKYRKEILITAAIVIVSLFGMNLFCNINQITSGSKAEMLSIPFQQTARYVKYYEKDVTENEREVINKVLNYNKLSTDYEPRLSDPIKNTFNQRKPTNDELKDYFKVWFQMFLKHPLCYVEATLNNQIDNFYGAGLNVYTVRRSYGIKTTLMNDKYNDDYKIQVSDFGFQTNNKIDKVGKIVDKIIFIVTNTPIIGLIAMPMTYIWFLIILLITANKKNKNVFIFSSFFILYFCTILLGPCDAIFEFRYILPFVISSPLFYLIWKNLKHSST